MTQWERTSATRTLEASERANGSCATAAHGPLRTLDAEQLRLAHTPVTVVPKGMKIWGLAWLQFGNVNVRCGVQVKRWTADALGVEFTIDEERLRCWIWQGACRRLENRTDAW